MAQKRRDLGKEPNAIVPETEPGTPSERDFGKSDRHANEDQEGFSFRTMGDETAWDAGREASITDGSRIESETRAADAGTPGVKTRKAEDESR
jgi:hypothetical protein